MRIDSHFEFPEVIGEDKFDLLICESEGDIYLKEVHTGDIWQVSDLREALLEMPEGYTIGVLMPDGTVSKITQRLA